MTARCPHCHALTPKGHGPWTRYLVLGLGWSVVMGMVFGAAVIGPFVTVLIPVLLLGGVGLVAAIHEFAFGDRLCESCGRAYLIDGKRVGPEPLLVPAEVAPALAA